MDAEQIIQDQVDKLIDGLLKTGNNAFRRVRKIVNNMDTDEKGRLIRSTANSNAVLEATNMVINSFTTSVFQRRVDNIVNSLPKIAQANIDFYESKVTITVNDERVINGMVTTAQSKVRELLNLGTLSDEVVAPTQMTISEGIRNNRFPSSVIADLENRTMERMKNYATGRALTTMHLLNRDIANYLRNLGGLVWARYGGVRDSRNRTFCSERVGKYFHAAEIKDWVILDWDGKMDNTTIQNIFVNLGGWGCRHSLVWVDQLTVSRVEPEAVQRARNKGLIL